MMMMMQGGSPLTHSLVYSIDFKKRITEVVYTRALYDHTSVMRGAFETDELVKT